MDSRLNCLLCGSSTDLILKFRDKCYYRCTNCLSVMLDPAFFISSQEEKQRYEEHNNDVYDQGYRKFVMPLVEKIFLHYSSEASGLDYGAGPGPVASVMLKEKGYRFINRYDPFYHPDRSVLKKKYHFIICSEVMEHFHYPSEDFKLLRSLLMPGGSLFCLTNLYHEHVNFEQWYYKNDPTHVFFYHNLSLEWIKKKYSFNDFQVENRLIHFKTENPT